MYTLVCHLPGLLRQTAAGAPRGCVGGESSLASPKNSFLQVSEQLGLLVCRSGLVGGQSSSRGKGSFVERMRWGDCGTTAWFEFESWSRIRIPRWLHPNRSRPTLFLRVSRLGVRLVFTSMVKGGGRGSERPNRAIMVEQRRVVMRVCCD